MAAIISEKKAAAGVPQDAQEVARDVSRGILARSPGMADISGSTPDALPGAQVSGPNGTPAKLPPTARHDYAERLNALQGKKWKKWLNVQAPYRANLRRYKL